MNKPLFTFILTTTLLFSFRVQAAATTTAPVSGSILSSLIPWEKNCPYATLSGKAGGLYEPFSNITDNFPGAKTLKMDGKGCVNVAGATESLLVLLFNTALTVIIVLTVISISVAGIQYMTEQATGKVAGGAKKRLTNSLVALALGLLSYTILYTINKQLVNFTFNPASIDKDGSIAKGIADAEAGRAAGGFSSSLLGIEPIVTQTTPNSPYGTVPGSTPSWGEMTTPGNFSTYASFGSIRCSGASCSSSNPTVFGYLDGDGTVGRNGDNGIGNASWSSKPGCTADTGNTVTMGLALPQGFWRAAGINFAEVKNIGIKLSINGVVQRILPIVDDSQENLDFTFAAAKAYLDPTITNSNRINTAGKNVTFEIIKGYYLTNPKDTVIYTSNQSTFSNKIPCSI